MIPSLSSIPETHPVFPLQSEDNTSTAVENVSYVSYGETSAESIEVELKTDTGGFSSASKVDSDTEGVDGGKDKETGGLEVGAELKDAEGNISSEEDSQSQSDLSKSGTGTG